MLNPAKASPFALLNAAQNHFDKKQYGEAERLAAEVLKRDMADARALALMGEISAARGNTNIVFFIMAIQADPSNLNYQERFIELGGGQMTATKYEEPTERALLACLRSADKMDCSTLQRLWSTHLRHSPAFQSFGLNQTGEDGTPAFENIADFKPLLSPLFLLGVKNLVVYNPVFEAFITRLRRYLLEDFVPEKLFTRAETVALAGALSHYAFNTDYILDVTEEEQKKLTELQTGEDKAALAILACYAPLCRLENADDIEHRFAASEIGDVIRTQITDYKILRSTAEKIPALTAIDDSVSKQVQEQYEEFPYPRWKAFSAAGETRHWNTLGKNDAVSRMFRGKKAKILIAGCGTGHDAALMASLFPDAEVLAVDLSRSSLAYAARKAEEYGIKNIAFRHADILKLGVLEQSFDIITSGGVLHHLKNPQEGWRVLRGLLKPEGRMLIGLYSKIARDDLLKAQRLVREGNYKPDAEGMRAFRREIPRLLSPFEFRIMNHYTDFYNLNMFRDLLFHVQDHNCTALDIRDTLEKNNLAFEGFSLPASALESYERDYPADAEKTDLENWHKFEEKNPATFRQMYLFWCMPLKTGQKTANERE